VPADTIINLFNPAKPAEADLAAILDAVTNPQPVTGGIDPEDATVIRQLAPEAFRALTFRAVRPEDYAEIAERLPWVQRAGARFRWTGSWLTAFVTPDPLGSFRLAPELRTELANLMDAVRQVGREVFVRNPRYVNIDLEIEICVEPSAYAGQVKAAVLEAMLGRTGVRPIKGFFDPDNFTFGTPLRRAALEAAVQDVPGVLAVEEIRIRARGVTDWRVLEELTFEVHDDQIIRLQNDPRFPERGSLRILVVAEQPA
jgi:predicted phage baseplate assembly protein